MRRWLIYFATGSLAAVLVLIASLAAEVRLGFLCLAAAILAGGWWLGRRFPPIPLPARGLRAAAVLSPVAAVALALLVPSTGSCPFPKDATSVNDCPHDHHILLKVLIILAGIAISAAAELASRRNTEQERTAVTQS